jgi:hypothetical protein
MISEITVPYKAFTEFSDIEFEGVCEVSVSLGCADFAKRDIDSDGFAVHLSLKTPDGKFLGNGAYAGMVTALDQEVLEKLWESAGESLSDDELFLSAGANEGSYLDDEGAICSDCLSAAGEFDEDVSPLNPVENCACWSCKQMILESMWEQSI